MTEKVNKSKKRSVNRKPKGFNEFEDIAKGILEGQGISYYEWLHEQHKKMILDFNLTKKSEVAELAKEG